MPTMVDTIELTKGEN